MLSQKNRVYVIGHKNPDTDSICSAIAYADLKNRTTHGSTFVPKRAGQINPETEYVLNKFQVEAPGLVVNVGGQVRDMDLHIIPYVGSEISIKDAWNLMSENDAVTLPITDGEQRLEGIVTIGDIAKYFMDPTDKFPLSSAKTQYKSMATTLGGKVIVGNELGVFSKGKVVVGAGQPEMIQEFMGMDDLVIVGDREDAQIAAITADASCIVISCDSQVSENVLELARKKSCVIITTPIDTYSIARLINQSIPVRFLMKRENLITFNTRDSIDEIKEIMARKRFRDFPVLDSKGRCKGTVSRRNLISVSKKQLILVDHNEKDQAVDSIEEAEVLEIIDHHKIGAIDTVAPIYFRNQPVGCTATIIFQMYKENELSITPEIAGLLCSAILSDTLMFRSPTCTKYDQDVAFQLATIADIDIEKHANEMFKAGANMGDKSPEEIFYTDFKKFSHGDISFGVGQITSMDADVLGEIEEKIYPLMEKEAGKNNFQMVFFMLTNIRTEATHLLCFGEMSEQYVENAFRAKVKNHRVFLPDVVSRKKQFIPLMVNVIQEI